MKLLLKIIKVLALIVVLYTFMGLTVCSRIYGPNSRVSEKSNNYHYDPYGIYYCYENKMFRTNAGEPYLNVFRMQNVDLSSFEVIGENYAKDKDHVYYQDSIFKGMDPTTFRADSFDLASDGKNLYWRTTLLEGMDPSSYKVYVNDESREKHYYYKMIVNDSNLIYLIDHNTIDTIDNNMFDASSFEAINFEWWKDKDKVMYNNKVTSVDPNSVYALKRRYSYNRDLIFSGGPVYDVHNYIICDKDWMYHIEKDSDYVIQPQIASDGFRFEFIDDTPYIKCGKKIILKKQYLLHCDTVFYADSDTPKIEVISIVHLRIDDKFDIKNCDSIPISTIK